MRWTVMRRRLASIRPALSFDEIRRRIKIVVVDDDEESFPTRSLQSAGYTIEWWEGITADRLRRLENGDFDIVILDIQGITEGGLSDTGDGLGVLRRIKNTNPHQLVVAFSGKSYDLGSVPFWKLADDSLAKPVTMIGCKELLDSLIRKHISVENYWAHASALLRQSGISERRIRKLEHDVASSIAAKRRFELDDLQNVIGAVDSIDTVLGWIKRIVVLCLAP